jgi:hypothetical protein
VIYKCITGSNPIVGEIENISNALEAVGRFHAAISSRYVCPVSSIVFVPQHRVKSFLAVSGNIDEQKGSVQIGLLFVPLFQSFSYPEPGDITFANV